MLVSLSPQWMFLIDAIKPDIEKKLNKKFRFFYATAYGRGVECIQSKTSFVSFRVIFIIKGNKNII